MNKITLWFIAAELVLISITLTGTVLINYYNKNFEGICLILLCAPLTVLQHRYLTIKGKVKTS